MSSTRAHRGLTPQRSIGSRAAGCEGQPPQLEPLDNSGGFVLVAVLVLITAMTALGAFGSRTAQVELQTSANHLHAHQALANAEAGVAHAVALLRSGSGSFNAELANSGTSGTLANLGGTQSVSGVAYRFRQLGSGSSDGYYVRLVDNHDETGTDDQTKDLDGIVKLVSLGAAGNGQRFVEVLIKSVGTWNNGFFGKTGVNMSGGAIADSYSGTYNPLNPGQSSEVSSNGTVALSGGLTHVYGNASSGTTVTTGGGATVTGTTTNSAPLITPAAVNACGPPYSSTTGISSSSSGCSPISNCYNAATGTLTVQGGNTVALANGSYCFSSVTIGGGSTVQVTGPVQMSLTAASDLSGGSLINATSDPANLAISSSFNSNGSTSNGIKLSGGSGAYFTFDGPNCAVIWSGGSDYYGAIIAAYIDDSGGTKMHFDSDLNKRTNATILGWHEVRSQ